ncbi:MAG: SNF2 helicase associated domain-containing protein, partial [Myxococcales bacterium]|nr:SNF2 helicase associated domain-containing protein [Myxococcales bacterium]
MVLAVDIESLRTRKLRKQVGQKTFTRGCQYFASGRVVEARRDGDDVVGVVTGSGREDYQVRIQVAKDGSIIRSECSCPYKHGNCKHRVALTLAALADPTLRQAESAGWGRILDEAEEVAAEYAGVEDAEERLVVRVDLPLNPDDVLTARLYKARQGKRGKSSEKPITAAQLKDALSAENDVLGLKRPEEATAARLAGLLEADDEDANAVIATNGNLDIFLRALSRLTEVYLGDSDRKLVIRLEPVRPRVRVDSLKNQGLSLKIQIVLNGKRRTLDKRARVAGEPYAFWIFDGEQAIMPMAGGPGIGVIVYGLSRKQARMPLREVPTFLERGLRRMRELIRVEADPGVLPDVTAPEPLLILGEDGESLKVQLSFRYGDPVELQVMSDSAPEVLRAPEGHEPLFVMRDLEAEKRALEAAAEAGLPVNGSPGTFLLDTPAALAFLEDHLEDLASTWIVLGRERLLRFRTKHLTPRLEGTIKTGTDWFDVNLEVVVDKSRYGLDALLQLYQSKRRYLTLDDGTLAILPDEWVTHHLKVAMELLELLLKGGIGRVPRYHVPVLDALVGDNPVKGDAEWERLSARIRNFAGLSDTPLPKGLDGDLRHYQKHGYDWLTFLAEAGFNGILADDMG